MKPNMAFNIKLQRCTLSLIKSSRLAGVKPGLSGVSLVSQHSENGRYMSSATCFDRIPRMQPAWSGNNLLVCSFHTTSYLRDSLQNSAANEINSGVDFATDAAVETAGSVASPENADVVFHSWADDPANIELITDGLHFNFPTETMWHLGLGSGLTPVGWAQNTIEMFYLGFGIPWFAAVAAATCIVRFSVFPIVVLRGLIVRRRLEALGVYQIQDPYERDRVMVENRISGLDYAKLPICHAVVWYSFYKGIKQMIAAPVTSMTSGGYHWFVDITVPDPLFVLPAVATVTSLLWFRIWNGHGVLPVRFKTLVLASPVIMVPASLCPSAFLSFWITSNILSISQALLMKYPRGRKFLGIRDEHTKNLKLLKDL